MNTLSLRLKIQNSTSHHSNSPSTDPGCAHRYKLQSYEYIERQRSWLIIVLSLICPYDRTNHFAVQLYRGNKKNRDQRRFGHFGNFFFQNVMAANIIEFFLNFSSLKSDTRLIFADFCPVLWEILKKICEKFFKSIQYNSMKIKIWPLIQN